MSLTFKLTTESRKYMKLVQFIGHFSKTGRVGWIANDQQYRIEFRVDGQATHWISYQALADNPPQSWEMFMDLLISRKFPNEDNYEAAS